MTAAGAALVLLATLALVTLGRPEDGPLPVPSGRPVVRLDASVSPTPTPISSNGPPPSDELAALPVLDPPESPSAIPGECLTHSTIIDYAFEPTVSDLTRQAEAVVIARVVAVGSGWWNTANGAPPRDLDGQITPVSRLIRLDVERFVAGQAVPESLVVWAPGGTIGCQTWFENDSGPLGPGDRFVVFVGLDRPAARIGHLRSANAWLLIDLANRVWADGRDLTLDAFVELVRSDR
jgi:hypothetical protein